MLGGLVEQDLDLFLDRTLRRLRPPPFSGGTTSPSESVNAALRDDPIPIAEPFTTTTRLSSGIAFSWLDWT